MRKLLSDNNASLDGPFSIMIFIFIIMVCLSAIDYTFYPGDNMLDGFLSDINVVIGDFQTAMDEGISVSGDVGIFFLIDIARNVAMAIMNFIIALVGLIYGLFVAVAGVFIDLILVDFKCLSTDVLPLIMSLGARVVLGFTMFISVVQIMFSIVGSLLGAIIPG